MAIVLNIMGHKPLFGAIILMLRYVMRDKKWHPTAHRSENFHENVI